jgi:pimeloyl-ACP methyl ester carboxylesterase
MFEKIIVTVGGKTVPILVEKRANAEDRPPCFIVGLSTHYHDKFSEAFRSFYNLVFIDLYWTGNQFPPHYVEKLTMERLVDHLEEVRAQLEMQEGERYSKIFIAAHSAYGFISIDYALKYPDRLLGVINIASPLIFNAELLVKWQEEYLHSNFGSPEAGGPVGRFYAYYAQKKAFAAQEPSQSKQYFVDWYSSLGTLFWRKKVLWDNEEGEAAKIWEPWKVPVVDRKTEIVTLEVKDINMPMMFRYIELVTNRDCYEEISKVRVPVLWVIGLEDLRVSLYQLEDARAKNISDSIEFFHPAQGSHWLMYPRDGDTSEFDEKSIGWGAEILKTSHEKNSLPHSKL